MSLFTRHPSRCFFFFNDTATTEIYTLSLHDALPISEIMGSFRPRGRYPDRLPAMFSRAGCRSRARCARSEEHTSELQSPCNLVCRLLLEKKKSHCGQQPKAAPTTQQTVQPTTWPERR